MRERSARRSLVRAVAFGVAACLVVSSCSGSNSEDGDGSGEPTDDTTDDMADGSPGESAGDESTSVGASGESGGTDQAAPPSAPLVADGGHAAAVESMISLLPSETRGVYVVDLDALLDSDQTEAVGRLLDGDGADPSLVETFSSIGRLVGDVDIADQIASGALVNTTEASDGQLLIASARSESIDDVVAGAAIEQVGAHGSRESEIYVDTAGNHIALLPGGVFVSGTRSAVESVVDALDDGETSSAHPIDAFLPALDRDAHVAFVQALPALFDDIPVDRSLRGAAAVSGTLNLQNGAMGGEMAFHTSNAAEFVESYNALDRAATEADTSPVEPLELADPVTEGLDVVVVTVPPLALDASFDDVRLSRNLFKKLFAGMEAHEYAEGLDDRSTRAWLDFRVKSEVDGDVPPSPASVYIRREFRDDAAIEAFEQNELPAGFRLAPTQFLESDDPDGEYFLALNLYDAGGGSIVGGARAEWDVFVHGPDGADPNAGERPRFFVVEALAEEVSADPGNLLTPAEPVSHELIDGVVVSSVGKFVDGVEQPVFAASFPPPRKGAAEVARFSREMAIGNDYIYWEHAVSDRVFYNATTFNHDAYFVDLDQLEYTDLSQWAKYLKPTAKDAVYYENSLEYVASPMANLDSEFLDISPEWLAELVAFTTNGHQTGLMRNAVEQLFRGEADPFVERRVSNENPTTYYHFDITDPVGLEAALALPPGHELAPISIVEGTDEAHYLTLSVIEFDDAIEGTRAEWSVYTDDGAGRPPRLMIVDLMTAEVAFDPVGIVNLPSLVRHELSGEELTTTLGSVDVTFQASLDTEQVTAQQLTLDWIEAGDTVCARLDVCDKYYYDAETLDVPAQQPSEVVVAEITTPWNDYIDTSPTLVLYRDNAQEYAVNQWYDLDVVVDELPFAGLEDATHSISGTGSLVGRETDLVDSQYTYSGDAIVGDDGLVFAIDQQIDNALGIANIFTTGGFDFATASGTQTVVDCTGPALLCSDIVSGSTTFYEAQSLDATDPGVVTWMVDVAVDLGGSFGTADSSSAFTATSLG